MAREMYNTIFNLFKRHNVLNKLAARRKFYTAALHGDEQIITYINHVHKLAFTLTSIGVEIDVKSWGWR